MVDEGYSHEHRPLRAYSTLTSVFTVAFGAALLAAKRRRGGLPTRYSPWDVVTAGVATHKVSRTLTKEKVTSYIRAPFVRYEEPAGRGEVSEQPRGEGLRLAVGELLVCPYCVGQWVATGFGVGLVAAPELTRFAAFVFTAEALADFLQLAYKAAEDAQS